MTLSSSSSSLGYEIELKRVHAVIDMLREARGHQCCSSSYLAYLRALPTQPWRSQIERTEAVMVGYAPKFLSLNVLAILCLTVTSALAEKPAEVLALFEKQTLKLPDGKLMNCHQRPGNGPTLVLVPGTWGDIHRFTPLIAELPKNIPIVVIELCWQGGHIPPTLALRFRRRSCRRYCDRPHRSFPVSARG